MSIRIVVKSSTSFLTVYAEHQYDIIQPKHVNTFTSLVQELSTKFFKSIKQTHTTICEYKSAKCYSSSKRDFRTENASERPVTSKMLFPAVFPLHFGQCTKVCCHRSTHALQPIMLRQHCAKTGSSIKSKKQNERN